MTAPRAPEPRALEILLDTFWTSRGWRDEPVTAPDDLAWARSKGLMFDPTTFTHADQMERLEDIQARASDSLVANAFVASLCSRRVDLRAGFASWAVVRRLKPHRAGRGKCPVCGLPDQERLDLNVLNFERHKFGGVRHTQISFAIFDLLQLLAFSPFALPTADDLALFKQLLAAASAQEPKARAAHLLKAITPLVKGNKNERSSVLTVMAIGGLLCPPEHAAYLERFSLLPGGSNEFGFPLCEWRGAHGVNLQVLEQVTKAL